MSVGPEDLPALQQAVLDDAMLEALVGDLQTVAQILEVTLKQAAQEHSGPQQVALDEAVRLLRAGSVRGIQVHYRHQGQLWTDTLLTSPAGVRLVRMAG